MEQAESVEVSAPSVVAAATALAKLNAAGQWIDRTEQINLNSLFDRMTGQELKQYAKDGILPDWFTSIVGATPLDSQEDKGNG